MTAYEQLKMQEMKENKMFEQRGVCAGCCKEFRIGEKIELAHILPQRKWVIEKYGVEIVHHPRNMVLTHSGFCNSSVQISPNKTGTVESHVKMISDEIQKK